jgi:type III pantothenate kinase
MAWLLIDNSNSRTKFALGDAAGLLYWRAIIATAELSEESLVSVLQDVDFTAVVYASVVPLKVALFSAYFSALPIHAVSFMSPLGFGFEVAHPEQVGNDRLANLCALKARFGAPAIAIDFGTAVTFSVISKSGNFSGGAIAPGMSAMTDYLASHTAQLPKIELREPFSAIGKNTAEALLSGAVYGQRGMVREILSKIAAELGEKCPVIATGGGAVFACKNLPEIDEIEPNLTLEGIRLVAVELFGGSFS